MEELLYTIYILQCSDGSYYTGITTNLTKRLEAHNLGKGAKYTSTRLPVKLLKDTGYIYNRSEATKLEYQIKKQSKKDKLEFLEKVRIKYIYCED